MDTAATLTSIRSRKLGFWRTAISIAGVVAVLPAVVLPLLVVAVMATPALLIAIPLMLAGSPTSTDERPSMPDLRRVALSDTH